MSARYWEGSHLELFLLERESKSWVVLAGLQELTDPFIMLSLSSSSGWIEGPHIESVYSLDVCLPGPWAAQASAFDNEMHEKGGRCAGRRISRDGEASELIVGGR